MSQVPPVTASASGPEKQTTSTSPASAPAPKSRSCVVCSSRKVRCDRQSPCSNCRRANIACVFPSTHRPPKWARRLDRITNNATASNTSAQKGADPGVGKVMDRLRNLESLVKELSGQLEQAHAAATSSAGGSSGVNSPGASAQHHHDAEHQRETLPPTSPSSVQTQFGRLVLQDASRSRYISSGFWSRVDDELNGLKMDTRGLAGDESGSSEDEATRGTSPSTQELGRTPSERHAFLFRHNLNPSVQDLREFHPLPSQIPFLLDMFSENVNYFGQVVHIPTVTKMVRSLRGSDMTHLSAANEALLFSIYYAAITSMEEDDVMSNFGSSKTDLNLKYRLGLEHALAKADFLNAPDIVLVQAFAIFLSLLRRHDSPRFVWMLTGLLIRMAQYLGLQRDGTHFENLTPFEIEMRRRVWWAVCLLDMRASEDQGTDLTIASGSFDTKTPLNINDADINPESKEMPTERDGVTDMSFARISIGSYEIMRRMMTPGSKDSVADLEHQSILLKEIYQEYEHKYLQHTTESGNIAYWVAVTVARLVMAKMTLIVFLPILFSSPSEYLTDEIRTKLLVAAIEVAEYNHALNAEEACRQWRWVFQTYTHWHAIVYLMLDISRRPWSPIVERAWVALHSSWLIPVQSLMDENMRMWFPLRKVMAKARKHRVAELNRLRADPPAAARLDMDDQKIPLPASSGLWPAGSGVDIFRDRWRKLVAMPPEEPGRGTPIAVVPGPSLVDPSMRTPYTRQPTSRAKSAYSPGGSSSNMTFEPTYLAAGGEQQTGQLLENSNIRASESTLMTNTPNELAPEKTAELSYSPFLKVPTDWFDGRSMGPGFMPWLWADADPSVDVYSSSDVDFSDVHMDVDSETNWLNWVESAKGWSGML